MEREEETVTAGMSVRRKQILGPTRLKLFEEMLRSINYDDVDVIRDMVEGCSLVGEVVVANVLDTKLKPARAI